MTMMANIYWALRSVGMVLPNLRLVANGGYFHRCRSVGDVLTFKVQEVNPLVKVANFIVGIVPFMELFTGKILNPTYRLARLNSSRAMRMRKSGPGPDVSWNLGRIFSIEKDGDLSQAEQEVAVLSLMIVAMNEGTRG